MTVDFSTRATRSASGSPTFRIVDALNAEWKVLKLAHPHHSHPDRADLHHSHPDRAHPDPVRRWGEAHAALSTCSDLDDVLDCVRRSPDPALFALLQENANGDELAGRVVLQAMLGKIVLLARRDRAACVDDYVAAVWCRIRTYPLEQRPDKIAANLALDTLKLVSGENGKGRNGLEVVPIAPGPLLDQLRTEAVERMVEDHNAAIAQSTAGGIIEAARELGLIDGQTRAVLHSVYSDGLSGVDAAGRHQTTAAMIRFRCSKAVRRLAEHASALAEAA